VNYLLGVRYEDDFRFRLVSLTKEERAKAGNQSLSQTEWITCYSLYRNQFDETLAQFNLNIIDTPGFADTSGLERDKQLLAQIFDFFRMQGDEGVSTIDGICFVTQSSNTRLTAQERYVFNYVLSIFGMNISENMFALVTFADSSNPPVLKSLEEQEVKLTEVFTFNNSALFSNKSKHKMSPMFWEMGQKSFKKFFKHIAHTPTKTLQISDELVTEKTNIEECFKRIYNEIKRSKSKNSLRSRPQPNTENGLKMKKMPLPYGLKAMNCQSCGNTCHCPCDCRRRCIYIQNNQCILCSGKCPLDFH